MKISNQAKLALIMSEMARNLRIKASSVEDKEQSASIFRSACDMQDNAELYLRDSAFLLNDIILIESDKLLIQKYEEDVGIFIFKRSEK
jgi:vacuolar-type H+-ATPase catalytic subunit A/Vma1